jgi:hypothetical protein
MATLKELADRVGALAAASARDESRASFFVKCALLISGAALSAIAQGVELAHSNGEFSVWTILGFVGAACVALGSIYLVLKESDTSQTLETARQVVEEARQFERQIQEFEDAEASLSKQVRRGLELYNSMDVMRGAIEQSLGLPDLTSSKIIQTCLDVAINSLLVAFDFATEDTWTIAVFEAHKASESDKATLRCVAMSRKILCDISAARKWDEGVGVAGVAYSSGNEIVISDMSAPELDTVFKLKANARTYDVERYRSMVAVPITVGQDKMPWGVAVVTTDKPLHFNRGPANGVSTSEPIRAIAAMSALAIRAVRSSEPATCSAAPIPETAASA